MAIGDYVRNNWNNGGPPALNADNLNNLEGKVTELDGNVLNTVVSASGLVGHWRANVPEIPNDTAPAQVQKISTNFTAADGWSAVRCTLSYSSGEMILTATDTNPGVTIAFTPGATIRVRCRRISGSGLSSAVRTIGTVELSQKTYENPAAGHVHDTYITVAAGTTVGIYPGGFDSNAVSGDVYAITFIYIGTGAYLANSLLDNSGNGNHGTIYGATPVEGISGKALAFDGVNDYVTVPTLLIPNVMTFHCVLPGNVAVANSQTLISYGLTSAAFIWIYRIGSSNTLRLSYWNGASAVISDFVSYFSGYDSTQIAVCTIIDFSSATIKAYRNGILYGTNNLTTPTQPTSGTFNIGRYQGGGAYNFSGTIDDPRIYNRALTEAEITSLYRNFTQGNDNVTRDAGPSPNSIVVRDSTGAIDATGIQFPAVQVASTDANTLDCYEEGSWTPTLIGSTTPGTQTYAANGQVGRYTRIGNRCHISGRVEITTKSGTMAGNVRVGGLPFTAAIVTNNLAGIAPGSYSGFTFESGRTQMAMYVASSGTIIELVQGGSNVAAAFQTVSGLAASASISFAGTYQV